MYSSLKLTTHDFSSSSSTFIPLSGVVNVTIINNVPDGVCDITRSAWFTFSPARARISTAMLGTYYAVAGGQFSNGTCSDDVNVFDVSSYAGTYVLFCG